MPEGWSSQILSNQQATSGCPKAGELTTIWQTTSGCPKAGEPATAAALNLCYDRVPVADTGFPAGPISVREASLTDETNGRDWVMQHATDVRFLAVRGTIMIGTTPLYYCLYIDEVPWVIFSNLNDALLKEFDANFFATLNCERKDRWGFQSVAWLDRTREYDVDTPYYNTWLSIFDTYGNTCREVRPFEYNHDHLRVHRNGAAIYAEEKKLVFLLPLIVEAHRLLPDMPIFWANDNNTLSLYKTSMWMHEDTIKWLAETGAQYPPALRPRTQPRIDAIRNWQQGRRQPPPPPQPNRWQERKSEKSDNPAAQDPMPSRPQPVKLSPRNMVADDQLYMDLQEAFLEIASSAPTPKGCSSHSARASQAAAGEEHSKPPKQKSPENTAKVKKRSKKAARVEAGRIAAQRPTPPVPKEAVKEATEPDKTSPEQETPKQESQAQESSSYDSSSTSSSSSDAPDEPEKTDEPDQKEETGQ